MKRGITNREAAEYVRDRLDFETSNKTIFGVWKSYRSSNGDRKVEELYVVYSYGVHFPMWIYSPTQDQWYGNRDRYSRTTSKHQTITNPNRYHPNPIEWHDTDWMSRVAMNGILHTVAARMEYAYA